MANPTTGFGFRPVRTLNGAPLNMQGTPYYVPSTYATALYVGDPVIQTGTANAAAFMGYPAGTLNTVQIATAGASNLITGIIVGVLPVTRETTVYRAASTENIVFVIDDPNVIFQIRDDGGGVIGAAGVGLNAMFILGAGSTTTGLSGYALDAGTSTAPAVTATYQLKILAAANIQNNDATLASTVWDVLINQHSYMKNVAGV